MKGLKGKNALVTGASSGIGRAIAIRLGQEGGNVAINYLKTSEGAEETQRRIECYEDCAGRLRESGGEVSLIQADVSKEEDVTRMVRTALEELGSLDFLVNNAGIQLAEPSEEVETDSFDAVLAVNLRGAYLCAREVIRHFLEREKPGVIINVSSVHEIIPKPGFASYSLSKGGMRNLTRTLALEYARRGIRVNAIGPGATVTRMNRSWVEDSEKKELVENHIPMGRAGDAEEMAAATAFLCSDEARYITGQTLFIDGGLTLYPDFRTTWSSE